MTDVDLRAHAHNLLDEVRAQADIAGIDLAAAWTEMVLDLFNADGLSEDARAADFSDRGAEINGWGMTTDERCLDLFITRYSPRADDGHRITKSETGRLFRRAETFVARCLDGSYPLANADPAVADLCRALTEAMTSVDTIRILLITNARSVLRESPDPARIAERTITRELWDLRRLANWSTSGLKAEPIIADCTPGIPCLVTPATDEGHDVILAVIPGQRLADLYAEYGSRLLELNVRSFLQVRSAVNKGILETIRSTPQRFLAYNNGISATASRLDTQPGPNGTVLIRAIHNLQIVNGGQTTATIHHAARNRIDLGDIRVQMKLTVVPPDRLDDIVPQISAYSNTQNRVTASDLRANSGYHVEVERVMRTLWAPAGAGSRKETHWFYERARGQYATALSREATPARQRAFRATNPPAQKFSKADLAKYLNTWAMLPHLVSLGAEKNFVIFTEMIANDPVTVDKDYCRQIIAKTILFRRADKLIAQQKYGGYKANIVTYTVAKIVHATRGGMDLDRIWRDQTLTPAVEHEIVRISGAVHLALTKPPGRHGNISEWAKRRECWDTVRDLDLAVSQDLSDQLIQVDTYTDDLAFIRATNASAWRELTAWGDSTGQLPVGDRLIATEIANALDNGWDPAGRHTIPGAQIMRTANANGFRPADSWTAS